MIRVDQTILGKWDAACERGEEPGDCLRAAVASVFERDLSDVPHFVDTGAARPGNITVWLYAWHSIKAC